MVVPRSTGLIAINEGGSPQGEGRWNVYLQQELASDDESHFHGRCVRTMHRPTHYIEQETIMLVITNRNINDRNLSGGIGDHRAFGDQLNIVNPNEIRLAKVDKLDGQWRVELLDEIDRKTGKLASEQQFRSLRESLLRDSKNCVFLVHGFRQSFKKSLKKGWRIQQRYGVEVIVFSWPSNPGGLVISEYRDAKRMALASAGALDKTLEKLGAYLHQPFNLSALQACETRFSLMAYSLGNLLLKNYVESNLYNEETQIFENIVLCQADVDNRGHRDWVENINSGRRIYITINENDKTLGWSDINFQPGRLGNTFKNLNAANARYYDFSNGPYVGNTHGVFYEETNDVVKEFFNLALNGKRVETLNGMTFDARANAYRF